MNPMNTSARMAAWLESAWLARYLDRQLSDDEAAWFEGYLMDKEQLVRALEADDHLRKALASAVATTTDLSLFSSPPTHPDDAKIDPASVLRLDGLRDLHPSVVVGNSASRMRRPNHWIGGLRVAAAFLVGAILPFALMMTGQRESARSAPVLATATLGVMRGAESAPLKIVLPKGSGVLLVEIPPLETKEFPARLLTVRMQRLPVGEEGISIENVVEGHDGYLSFVVPIDQLSAGSWIVVLSERPNRVLGRYSAELLTSKDE